MNYVIGLDFGTLSVRGLLLSKTGEEVASSEYVYPHKILDGDFFREKTISNTDAFQHPGDYIEGLGYVIKDVIEKSGVSPDDIKAIGVDFTSCTVLPVTEDGTPLCFIDEFKGNPHAYVKLWKHHGAQKEANEMTALAIKEELPQLKECGGKVSSEMFFPKIIEILRKAPDVYERADRFVEAGDWIVWMLTGKECHSSCMAGFKAMWNEKLGYPENSFWAKIDKRLDGIIGTKVSEVITPVGDKAGNLSPHWCSVTTLKEGTAVACPIIDAHSFLPGAGIAEAGKLMLILGTSTCHITLGNIGETVENISGSVDNGVVKGFTAHEAGQCAVGDTFDWFVKNCVPEEYTKLAKKENKSIFTLLDEKASKIAGGENKVLAIDWWGGNRTPYDDSNLTGMLFGLTLGTKPEEIYRALIEATAFGTKTIVDIYEKSGTPVNEIYASGGIAKKNPLLVQVYADVLGKPVKVTKSLQGGARGSGVLAAAAGGIYETVTEAAEKMGDKVDKVYSPNPESAEKYKKAYKKYYELSEYFAKEK